MRNLFRCTPDGSLDSVYLRTCAIYRLLKHSRIGQARAIELQRRPLRYGHKPSRDYLIATIEIWKGGPLPNMLP